LGKTKAVATSLGTQLMASISEGLVDLANEIREGARNGAEKRVYLVADARAKYGDTMAVLVQIRLAGIESVSFLTEKPYR